MSSLFEGMARRALFTLDPETAHGLSIKALKSGMVPGCRADRDPRLATAVAGLNFPNPLGMAAGYDKNAEVASELAHLGFGFVEVGTLTPRAQTGNSKPRIFRLVRDQAGDQSGSAIEQMRAMPRRNARFQAERREGILGVNIGANKTARTRAGDYGGQAFRSLPMWRITSPSHLLAQHPGLRNLQTRAANFGPPEAGCLPSRDSESQAAFRCSQDRTGPHRSPISK